MLVNCVTHYITATLNKQAELALAASSSHEYSQAIQLRYDWL